MGPEPGVRSQGPPTIRLTVWDKGGAMASASVNVNVVNTSPQPVIATPTTGPESSVGSTLRVQLTVWDPAGAVNSYSRPVHLACTLIQAGSLAEHWGGSLGGRPNPAGSTCP